MAGLGHTVSTLVIACIVWVAGAVLAVRFGHAVSVVSSLALIAFGGWIALTSWLERRREQHNHGHSHFGHAHRHRHADGLEHLHWHAHHEPNWHAVDGNLALAPMHDHVHEKSSRTALLLILGSSPMVEGIPAFFAASRYGAGVLGIMAVVFAASTIATYVVSCIASAAGMQRINLGRFEEFGEIISGSFIAILGVVFLVIPDLSVGR